MRWSAMAALCALSLGVGAAVAENRSGRRDQIVTVSHDPPADTPTLGPRQAPVTIELFGDPAEVRTYSLHQLLEAMRVRHPTRLRVRYRLVGRGGRSNRHVEVAHEAFEQGLFAEYLATLYKRGRRHLRQTDPLEVARDAGLDLGRVRASLTEQRHQERARRDYYFGRRYRVRSVPSVLVNGVPFSVRDVRTVDALEAAYDDGYARAQTLLDLGVSRGRLYQTLLRQIASEQPLPTMAPGRVDGVTRGELPPNGPPPLVGGAVDTQGPHSRGPEDAEVVVVFYCNFYSRNCLAMNTILEELRAAYPVELRVVFKHLFNIDDDSQKEVRRLHEASLCADAQGAFWDYYERLYQRHQRRTSDDYILQQAQELEHLDQTAFKSCFENNRFSKTIDEAIADARKLGVGLTPSVIIGGRLYIGTRSFDELRTVIDHALAPGLLEELAPARDAAR